MKRSFLAALLLSAFAFPNSSFGVESPLYIPFQGQVTNQAGVLSADGQYSVIFNLYDQAVGGQPVWSERHVKIGVTKGMINVFLGSITPLTAVDFSQTKYLGITVDVDNLATTADPEMVPRSLIMSAFSSKQSERSRKMDVLDGGGLPVPGQSFGWASVFSNGNPGTGTIPGAKLTDGSVTVQKVETTLATAFVPPGTVLPYAGIAVPAGWALCDGGSKLKADPIYATLFATIGSTYGSADGSHFNLPDMRGRVPVGAGSGTGLTPRTLATTFGEELHTLSIAEMPAHAHSVTPQVRASQPPETTAGNWDSQRLARGARQGASGYEANTTTSPFVATDSTQEGGGLPHNVMQPSLVLNYIIKL